MKENYKLFHALPAEEWIEEEFLSVSDFLSQHGFIHYEVSNFSLPEKQSLHNLNYWKSNTVAALGPSATGFLNSDKLRYKWAPLRPEITIENLSDVEFKLEKIYMSLRSQEGIKLADFPMVMASIVDRWKQQKLVVENSGIITLTSKGYLLLDSLMNDLFTAKLI